MLRCHSGRWVRWRAPQVRRSAITARILDGKAVASKIRDEIAGEVAQFVLNGGPTPGLAVVLVGDDPASHAYVRGKERASAGAGFYVDVRRLPASVSQPDLLATVAALNADGRVHGIIVQLPLPPHLDEAVITRAIDPMKDVDGLLPENLGLLMSGNARFVPATPLGVQRLLAEEGIEIQGAKVVICGRSNIVGKPLAALLIQKGPNANATVTVCHTGTRNLQEETRRADILIAAIGRPASINAAFVRPGAVVVDVGISRVNDPGTKSGYRLAGDVDYDPVSRVASAITPVPGGVGPMTIAMLLHNVLHAARLMAARRRH